MKITIESLENGDAKLTLNFKGKDYSETWRDYGGDYRTIDKSIVEKLERVGITAENTDLEDMLTNIDATEFIRLAEIEDEW